MQEKNYIVVILVPNFYLSATLSSFIPAFFLHVYGEPFIKNTLYMLCESFKTSSLTLSASSCLLPKEGTRWSRHKSWSQSSTDWSDRRRRWRRDRSRAQKRRSRCDAADPACWSGTREGKGNEGDVCEYYHHGMDRVILCTVERFPRGPLLQFHPLLEAGLLIWKKGMC